MTTVTAVHSSLPTPERPIRLIASDLDGTLLQEHSSVSARTAAAIDQATAVGVTVIAATGRQAPQLPEAVTATGIRYVVASNGGIGVDLTTNRVLFEDLLTPDACADIVAYLTTELEGVRFSAVREHGARHACEPGYLDLLTPLERRLDWHHLDAESLADVVAEPTLKLTVRHPRCTADDLLAVLAASGLGGFHATTSGAPFLEIQGAGVTKASGVAQLCALLGVDAIEVLAAGDAKNDIELLRWAGIGVAMGNAVPEAKDAADWTTTNHDEDGLALAIELLLEGAHFDSRGRGIGRESGRCPPGGDFCR